MSALLRDAEKVKNDYTNLRPPRAAFIYLFLEVRQSVAEEIPHSAKLEGKFFFAFGEYLVRFPTGTTSNLRCGFHQSAEIRPEPLPCCVN